MRLLRLLPAVFLGLVLLMVLETGTSYATFHCMRIHAVMAGFQGNNAIQYVELRMSAGGQTSVGGHTLRFYDGSDTLKATFTFPGSVGTGTNGSSILVATAEFDDPANSTGGDPNFVFSGANTVGANGGDPLHPIQATGGRVVWAGEVPDFNCNSGPEPVDAVAYGSATAVFGSAAVALPSPSDNRALRLDNIAAKPSDNSAEYSLEQVATSTFTVPTLSLKSDLSTPRNNSGVVIQLLAGVGGIAEAPGVDAAPVDVPSDGAGSAWFVAIATSVATAAVILAGAGAWYARRRIVARASWWDE